MLHLPLLRCQSLRAQLLEQIFSFLTEKQVPIIALKSDEMS